MDYRHEARKCLKRAEEELGTGDHERLKYASLELRMAMEALTYDRALAYKDEFPPKEYETWQPKKVISVLLDIDPSADKDSSLAVGLREEPGVPPSVMTSMGSEKVLNMAILKDHYDALGSYLHLPSMKQTRTGKTLDFVNIRCRCEEIAAFVRAVLASTVFNVVFGTFTTANCAVCKKPIRKRMPFGQTEARAECQECHTSYKVVEDGDSKTRWIPLQCEVECPNESCRQKSFLPQSAFAPGKVWICASCNGHHTFLLECHMIHKEI